MYERNIDILKKTVSEHGAVMYQHVIMSTPREEYTAKNLQRWNDVMAPYEKIQLWPAGKAPEYDDRDPLQPEPYMVFIPAPRGAKNVSTIIVAPGGGFQTRTGYEGVNVALFFHNQGFNTAILTYRLSPYNRIDAMNDMQRAIRVLRSMKNELGISDMIAAMGFSAGGMLSANCATHFDSGNPDADDPVERFSCRPDAAVICYGAFTFVSAIRPLFTRGLNPMAGRDYREAVYLAPEHNVTPDCPPFYIWQTLSDDGRHGMTLARALEDVGVPYELHIFQSGMHGIALADGENDPEISDAHCAHWAELCAEWLRFNKFESA